MNGWVEKASSPQIPVMLLMFLLVTCQGWACSSEEEKEVTFLKMFSILPHTFNSHESSANKHPDSYDKREKWAWRG